MNENADMNIKIQKYPGESSTDILDHLKSSLRKEADQILIHTGTSNLTNDHNYLNNVKEIVNMVKETCEDTKFCFSSLIFRIDLKDIIKKVIKTNRRLKNCYKQLKLDLSDNGNIQKSDLNTRGQHLQDHGSSKTAKTFLD